jgi:hypothetical protein
MSQQPRLNPVLEANRRLRRANHKERQRDVIDRLQQLQVILPAMALEAAVAKRDAARLRRENAELLGRLSTQESAGSPVSFAYGNP